MTVLNLQILSLSSSQIPFPSLQSPHISPPKQRFLSLRPQSRVRIRVRVSLNCHEEKGQDVIFGEPVENLGEDSEVFKKTLRLVECSMFASVAGLAYLLSNSLAIENYFGCFFSLPIVISSMRWGLAAGRKTMVAMAMLLLILSGPVKASTYLLMHGLVGVTMGSLWMLGINWGISIALCTAVRALGAVGYVLISSFLIRENILNLITINIHASLTYILMAVGVNNIPTMDVIYTIFGSLLLLNCGFFIFLLHILYAVFLSKLGMKESFNTSWMARESNLTATTRTPGPSATPSSKMNPYGLSSNMTCSSRCPK